MSVICKYTSSDFICRHRAARVGATIWEGALQEILDELERRDLNTALVTLCIGAGMGTATIIERV